MSARRAFLRGEDSDRILAGAPRPELETQIDMTSMIDVTFLLLIFFMVTASLTQSTEVDVPPAELGKGVEAGSATFVTVLEPARREAAATILWGDGEGPEVRLDEVTERVREGRDAGRLRVIVKAERRVPHREVQRVASAVAEVEGVTLHIGVRDKR